MRATKKMVAALLMAVMVFLSVASALAEGSQPGGFAAPSGDKVYVSINENGQYSLYSVPSTGGDLTFIESAPIITDLVFANNNLYYIRYSDSRYQIIRYDHYLGTSTILAEFNDLDQGKTVEKLSYYNGVLYCLVDGILTIVDPSIGDNEALCAIEMDDYTIADRTIYYISATDQTTYTKYMEKIDADVQAIAGYPYSLSLDGSNPEKLADVGVKNIQAQGDHIYFENLDDSYTTGNDPNYWLEGRLYRLNMQTRQLTSMNIKYTWEYYTTPNGVVAYTENDISIYPLTGGSPVNLMTPEAYTVLFAVGTDLYVYEQTKNILTKLPVNGLQAVQLVGSANTADDPTTTIEEDWTTFESDTDTWGDEDDAAATAKPTVKPTASPTKKPSTGTDSSYIFKDSNTKKLTRERILKVDKSLWPYARNEIYARHGYEFKTKKYKDYFAKKSWYRAGGFSTSDLNSTEWYNMDLLKEMEDEYSGNSSGSGSGGSSSTATDSSYIFPNSSTKKLTVKEVKSISKSLRPYARNEIYARHGYEFKTKKYADYFAKKTWYKKGGFSSGQLNDIEWYNMDLIKKYE